MYNVWYKIINYIVVNSKKGADKKFVRLHKINSCVTIVLLYLKTYYLFFSQIWFLYKSLKYNFCSYRQSLNYTKFWIFLEKHQFYLGLSSILAHLWVPKQAIVFVCKLITMGDYLLIISLFLIYIFLIELLIKEWSCLEIFQKRHSRKHPRGQKSVKRCKCRSNRSCLFLIFTCPHLNS